MVWDVGVDQLSKVKRKIIRRFRKKAQTCKYKSPPQNENFRNYRKNGMAKQAGERILAGLSVYL